MPVRWETNAAGFDSGGANRAIALSADFTRLDVIVVAVWNKVGTWTLEEYERALALRRLHRKPDILVFVRNQPLGEAAPSDVSAFRERVFRDGVVAVPYDAPGDFFALLSHHIQPAEPELVLRDDIPHLRDAFRRAGVANFLLALAVVGLSTTMSFPDNYVTMSSVLAILAAPILLLVTTAWAGIRFHRILQAFRIAWRSSAYTNGRIWLDFLPVVPRWAMPRYLRSVVPTGKVRDTWITIAILLALSSGPIASYNAVFNEIVVWEYVVGWQWRLEADGETITNVFVDRNRSPWRFGLQNVTVQDAHRRDPGSLVYVHAQGKFCTPSARPIAQRFRCNLGPEVKLLYIWLFFAAFVLSLAIAAVGLIELAWLQRTVMAPMRE